MPIVTERPDGRFGVMCGACFTVRTVSREDVERMSVDADAAAAFLARHSTHCPGGKR
jgi:hypothetical protein